MKKGISLIMVGAALLIFSTGQAYAFSVAEDMEEGLSLQVEQDNTTYEYDSLNASAPDSMTEYDFFPEENLKHRHFKGDLEILSLQEAMGEGLWVNYLPATAAGN